MIRADVGTIDTIESAVAGAADRLAEVFRDDPTPEAAEPGETALSVDDRRVLGLLRLVQPGSQPDSGPQVDLSDLRPQVTLYLHLDGRQDTELDEHGRPTERIARLEGHGPVTHAWIREVLGPHARFTVRPVFDPLGQAPVDAYEIPQRHRRAVRLMTPADVFPFGSCTSPTMQVDHTVPHHDVDGEGGPSAVGNYGPMTITHHRIKTHGRWQVRQPFPSIYVWRDPHGAYYLVDHSGTRRLPQTTPQTTPHDPRRRRPVLEVHHSPIRVELDLTA